MRIGVTGIYASGKGAVCAIFEDLGAKIIDTDILARIIVEPGTIGLKAIIKEFGAHVLHEDGTLNRRKFANIVFKDPRKVDVLNQITHPLVFHEAIKIIEKNPDLIYLINIPLLYESGFDKHMDYNIVVTAEEEQVIKRGINRDNISENEIKERLNNQISLNEKVKMADYIIDNSGSLEKTKRQVIELWKILQEKKIKE